MVDRKGSETGTPLGHGGTVEHRIFRDIIDYIEPGDVLVVGVNSDASTARLKGPTRPLQPQSDRMAVLDSVRYVDFVTAFEQDTPRDLIRAIRPDVIVKGSDYKPEEVVGGDDAKAWGGRVHIVDLLDGVSTTKLAQGEQVRRGERH